MAVAQSDSGQPVDQAELDQNLAPEHARTKVRRGIKPDFRIKFLKYICFSDKITSRVSLKISVLRDDPLKMHDSPDFSPCPRTGGSVVRNWWQQSARFVPRFPGWTRNWIRCTPVSVKRDETGTAIMSPV